jgi:hypothetical protein
MQNPYREKCLNSNKDLTQIFKSQADDNRERENWHMVPKNRDQRKQIKGRVEKRGGKTQPGGLLGAEGEFPSHIWPQVKRSSPACPLKWRENLSKPSSFTCFSVFTFMVNSRGYN